MGNTGVTNTPRSDTVIAVEGVSKCFGSTSVLKDVSFGLAAGEILGVIGPSGGGKTTLLRCIDLLDVIDTGCVRYWGKYEVSASSMGPRINLVGATDNGDAARHPMLSQIRSDIGFVFQALNLWEDRTVIGNLILAPMVVLGQSRKSAEARAYMLCDAFGLGGRTKSPVWELSGGQRQRVAIVRALMMEPRVMLLDEVTSALDPVLTVEVMNAITRLRDEGLAMVIVTHHIEFASQLCDRLMFLSDAQVVQLDTPERLRARPATQEVERFLAVLRAAR